jgi:hypothetical protein
MQVRAAKVLFLNVGYEKIMDQMAKDAKKKAMLVTAREIVLIGIKAKEVFETDLKVAVNSLYNEKFLVKHEQFKILAV